MARPLEEARKIVSELSPEDREILTIELGLEMEKIDPEVEKAWVEEIERRWQEIKDDKVKTVPGNQVLAEARRLLNKKNCFSSTGPGRIFDSLNY